MKTLSLRIPSRYCVSKFLTHRTTATLTKSAPTSGNMSLNAAKQLAANRAVDEWVKDDTAVGIGSGSTIVFAVQRLAERVKNGLNVICVPTSYQARQLILENGLRLSDLEQHPKLDVTIDGADEVDANMVLIKGGGGCMLQEKVVAACAKNLIIVADYTKNSQQLGEHYKKGVPLEVIPMAFMPVQQRIVESFGGAVQIRQGVSKVGPAITDNGNFILDWVFDPERQYDWKQVNTELLLMPGVVETGLFVNMAKKAYFGMADGTVKVQE